jgi:magnesium-transporting ATPase (P-type)
MTLAFAQILHLGNARSDHAVLNVQGALANRYAIAAVVVSILLQLAAAVDPLSVLLRTAALDLREWIVVAAFSSVPAAVGQVRKIYTSMRR